MTTSMAMEKQQKLLADAANFQDSSVDQVLISLVNIVLE